MEKIQILPNVILQKTKLALACASMALLLSACGGGDSSSETPANPDASAATDANSAPTAAVASICSIDRVTLSPASGTLSAATSSLRAVVDFQALPGEDVALFAYIASADNNDFIESDRPNIGRVNNGRGQVGLSFDLQNNQGFFHAGDPDQYTEVRIFLEHSGGSCDITQNVNFILVP